MVHGTLTSNKKNIKDRILLPFVFDPSFVSRSSFFSPLIRITYYLFYFYSSFPGDHCQFIDEEEEGTTFLVLKKKLFLEKFSVREEERKKGRKKGRKGKKGRKKG